MTEERGDQAQRSGMKLRVFQASVAGPQVGPAAKPERKTSSFAHAEKSFDSNQKVGAGNEIFQHWACLCEHNNPITGSNHIIGPSTRSMNSRNGIMIALLWS